MCVVRRCKTIVNYINTLKDRLYAESLISRSQRVMFRDQRIVAKLQQLTAFL